MVQRYRGYLAYIIFEDDDIIPTSESENKPQGNVRVRYNIIDAVTTFNCRHQATTVIINYYHNESTVNTSLVLPGPNNVKLKHAGSSIKLAQGRKKRARKQDLFFIYRNF